VVPGLEKVENPPLWSVFPLVVSLEYEPDGIVCAVVCVVWQVVSMLVRPLW
jgi:hypothetical protein